MGVSYLAVAEFFRRDGKTLQYLQFFTNNRVQHDSPKTCAEADAWIAAKLREHGTHDCRCTVAKVVFCITG